MKICRIMSREEYESLRLGLTLENHTVWKDKDRLSSAKGFCFYKDELTPETAIFLKDSVVGGLYAKGYDYAVEFELKSNFAESNFGIIGSLGLTFYDHTECYSEKYSLKDVTITKTYDLQKLCDWYDKNRYPDEDTDFATLMYDSDGWEYGYVYNWSIVDEVDYIIDDNVNVKSDIESDPIIDSDITTDESPIDQEEDMDDDDYDSYYEDW